MRGVLGIVVILLLAWVLSENRTSVPWRVVAVGVLLQFVLAFVFTVLLSSYYPWYYSWLAVFLCFVPNSAALTLTLILWPLYRSLIEQSSDDLFRFESRVFLPVFAVFLVSWIMRNRPFAQKIQHP